MRLTFALAHFAAEGVAPIFPSKCVTCPFCQGTESARERERSEKREARSEKREARREKREERRERDRECEREVVEQEREQERARARERERESIGNEEAITDIESNQSDHMHFVLARATCASYWHA
jgi:hypothetical protein